MSESKLLTMLSSSVLGASVLTVSLLAGCATTHTSKELLSARAAYGTAAADEEAKQRVPDLLLTAEQALEKAERAHKMSENSRWARTLAYIAERRAQLAVVMAETAVSEDQSRYAEKTYATLLEDYNRSATKDLGRSQTELAQKERQLEAREQELASKTGELTKTANELEQERKARQEAEAKASAALASLEEVGRVKEDARGMVITLSGAVLFKSSESVLLGIAEQQLAKVAEALQEQDEKKKIVIEGHTDSRGSDRTNLALSQQRADSVRVYLITQGVSADRIIAVGKGESQPIADNKNSEGRANNRRVEIIIGR